MNFTIAAYVVAAAFLYGAYRVVMWVLAFATRKGWLRDVMAVEREKGSDKLRISVGRLFAWNVTVNEDKGTAGGSIRVWAPKELVIVGVIVALVASYVVPQVSGWVIRAALLAIGAGMVKRLLH